MVWWEGRKTWYPGKFWQTILSDLPTLRILGITSNIDLDSSNTSSGLK